MSYYAPEDISSSPTSPTPYAQQQRSYPQGQRQPNPGSRRSSLQGGAYEGDLPQIAIERASADTSRGNVPYQPYGGAANSRTALHNNASTDSFNAEFDSAFGSYQPNQQPSPRILSVNTSNTEALIGDEESTTPVAGAKFHDRFKLNSPPRSNGRAGSEDVLDTFEPTPRQPNFNDVHSLGLGPVRDAHNRETSGMTDISYHTAGGSENGNGANQEWR